MNNFHVQKRDRLWITRMIAVQQLPHTFQRKQFAAVDTTAIAAAAFTAAAIAALLLVLQLPPHNRYC